MKRGGADEEMGRGRRVNDKREEEREEQGGQRRGEERKIVSGKKKENVFSPERLILSLQLHQSLRASC